MCRILVVGCPGNGKTTFSKALAKQLDIPLIHLDKLFWKSGWQEKSKEEFDAELLEILKTNKWIIDGNYSRTLPLRLERAEIVYFMDYPTRICLWRVLKRVITRHGETRSDMGENCPERFDMEFMKYVWNFRKTQRPKLMQMLKQSDVKNIYIIQNDRQLERELRMMVRPLWI